MKTVCEEISDIQEVKTGSIRPARRKKQLNRRTSIDQSQQMRRGVQVIFVLLNLWIGWEFYLFVRYCESGGAERMVERPAGAEGWLPIAALMNLKYFLLTGQMPPIHPAAMFLLIAFLAISWLFRKSFCSWLCPIGTLSELLWNLGRRLLKKNYSLYRWLDLPLRSLKYTLLGLFVYAVASLSPAAIQGFMRSPYGLIADVKMLDFFRYMSLKAALVLGFLVLASIFVKNFWCRYLCPYGALMGLAALLSPSRIRREPEACVDCTKCARVCPSLLPVDRLLAVRSAECTGCMECVAICPAENALRLTMGRKTTVPSWAMAVGILILFLMVVGYAKWAGHWESSIPHQIYFNLIPRAWELAHP